MSSIISSLSSTLTSGINAVQKGIIDTQTQLANGTKNLNAAEVGIVTRLSAQATGYKSVSQNITAGINVINVGGTALASISTILSQAKDIATQAANAGLQTSDRAALNTTFSQLLTQVTSLITNAGVNGENVLSGSNLTVQSGITGGVASQTTITNLAITLTSLGINASTVATQAGAQTAIDSMVAALNTVSTYQSTLSATKTGLDASAAASLSLSTNLQATVDSIQNIDQTALQAKLQQLNNQQAIDYYLVSQMNTAAQSALSIFR
jgi:flagellin-like hook-associated protein FlgL